MARKPSKSKAKAGKRVGKRRARRSTTNVREYASASVTASLIGLTSNTMYFQPNMSLDQYNRSVGIARQYQRFRIKSVTLRIKPNMDSITTVAAGAPQKAYVYFLIDKNGSIPNNVTLEGLKQAGAKPYALDERPFNRTFKPTVHTLTQEPAGVTSQFSQYKTSPWLTTNDNPNNVGAWNPNTTSHYGYKLFIEQVGAITTFNAELELQFEFIKPLAALLSAVPPTRMEYAVIDESPDGIEGGPDGLTIPIVRP